MMDNDESSPANTAPIPLELDEQSLVAWLRTQLPHQENLCNETLEKISQLCWRVYEKGLDVCAGFEHNEAGRPIFLNESEAELLVDGMLYLYSARYALDIDRMRAALKSLDAAAPAGILLSDHPIFEAAEVWCEVGEASRAARKGAARGGAENNPQDTGLPTPERVRAIADRARSEGYIKAVDWLTHGDAATAGAQSKLRELLQT